MKKYSLLIVGLLSLAMVSLTALEDTKQSFVESTKEDLKIASILYAAGYMSVTLVENCLLVPGEALIKTNIERGLAKQSGQKVSLRKTAHTFAKELKDEFLYINKGIIRSHRIAAPVVLGSVVAYNMYKQAHS